MLPTHHNSITNDFNSTTQDATQSPIKPEKWGLLPLKNKLYIDFFLISKIQIEDFSLTWEQMETVKSFHKFIYYHTRSSIKTIALKVQNNSTPFPQKGSLGNSCKDAGGHFNPGNKNHGDVNAAERHEGDFGNIVADNQGIAKISVVRYK